MTNVIFKTILTKENLNKIFPKTRTNEFFAALFGDASEGTYDIELAYRDASKTQLNLDLLLHERPNCCLVCNLTQGLPQVFARHPIININGVVSEIDTLLGDSYTCKTWRLGHTEQHGKSLHLIPLNIELARNQ